MWWQPVEDVAANLFAWLISEKGGDVVGFSVLLVICIMSVIRWHRRQRAAKKPGMASLPFIVAAFLVALIAIGFGCYGLGLYAAKSIASQNQSPQAAPALRAGFIGNPHPEVLGAQRQASKDAGRGAVAYILRGSLRSHLRECESIRVL